MVISYEIFLNYILWKLFFNNNQASFLWGLSLSFLKNKQDATQITVAPTIIPIHLINLFIITSFISLLPYPILFTISILSIHESSCITRNAIFLFFSLLLHPLFFLNSLQIHLPLFQQILFTSHRICTPQIEMLIHQSYYIYLYIIFNKKRTPILRVLSI